MIVEPKAREIGPMPPTRETGCATTSGAAHPQYLYLDALRGWAILMVMLVHVGVQLTASAGGHPLVALRPAGRQDLHVFTARRPAVLRRQRHLADFQRPVAR